MNSYQKGRRAEYYCKELLKQKGLVYVIRSAGSKGLADLVAIFPLEKEIWLIQVKTGKRTPSIETLKKRYKALKDLEGVYTVHAKLMVKKKNKYILTDID